MPSGTDPGDSGPLAMATGGRFLWDTVMLTGLVSVNSPSNTDRSNVRVLLPCAALTAGAMKVAFEPDGASVTTGFGGAPVSTHV